MQQGTNEQQLLQMAIEAFYRQTGLQLRAQAGDLDIGGRGIDAIVEVEGYKALRFTAEVKKWAQQKNMGAMLEQVRQLPGKGMLVADYVNPNMADKMREMDIPFVDTAGNAYINEKPLWTFSALLSSFQLYGFASERSGVVGTHVQMPGRNTCTIGEECPTV